MTLMKLWNSAPTERPSRPGCQKRFPTPCIHTKHHHHQDESCKKYKQKEFLGVWFQYIFLFHTELSSWGRCRCHVPACQPARGFNKCLVATYRPERGVCAHGELRGKYPEPAARSLGGTVLFAIGVAIVIEVQGTILLQIFLLLLPDSILVDPIINIIPWKFPTNCGHSAIYA